MSKKLIKLIKNVGIVFFSILTIIGLFGSVIIHLVIEKDIKYTDCYDRNNNKILGEICEEESMPQTYKDLEDIFMVVDGLSFIALMIIFMSWAFDFEA